LESLEVDGVKGKSKVKRLNDKLPSNANVSEISNKIVDDAIKQITNDVANFLGIRKETKASRSILNPIKGLEKKIKSIIDPILKSNL